MSAELDALELVPPGRLRDRLVDAVVGGRKTATSRLEAMDLLDGTPPEPIGTRMRLLDSDGATAAVVEIVEVLRLPLSLVDDEVARAEGDWFADVSQWRSAHERHWGSRLAELRRRLGDDEFTIDDDVTVVVRRFRLVNP